MHETNNPQLKSFISVSQDSHFPIQNLPYGSFLPPDSNEPRIGVAIGNQVLDLSVLEDEGVFKGRHFSGKKVFRKPVLNDFMGLGRAAWLEARTVISRLLRHDNSNLRDNPGLREKALVPAEYVRMVMPVDIGDYTDFYSSREHATNVGSLFRNREHALHPNWLHLPVGYHGRASSVVISGTPIRRPTGQILPADGQHPVCSPTRMLDFELETGFFTGPGNSLGVPVGIDQAADHIFGMVLVNDWSARDIQKWEYVPLGPFNSKNFGTSISPWIVTLDALEPFRIPGPAQTDPEPLPYLKCSMPANYDIRLEVHLRYDKNVSPHRLCLSNHNYLYWNILQQLAHHTITGCNIRPGDLLASGTISGPGNDALGCLLEITRGGSKPVVFPDGSQRTFLENGDEVVITGWCQGNGYRVGFGEVTGEILPPN